MAKTVKIKESLSVGSSKLYKVHTRFTGSFNSRTFNCKVGDTVMLSADEFDTYKRFIEEA